MTSRPLSLRLRLIGLILMAVGAVWMATAIFTYHEARHEVDELLDAHLAQAAAILIAQSLHELHENEVPQTPLLHHYARKVAFQVYTVSGELRLASANAPKTPLGDNRPGFTEREIEGQRWRVFSAPAPNGAMIHVGEIDAAREDVAHELIMHFLQPLLFALPFLALLLAFAVRRALRPLAGVTRELETRAADNLAPLSLDATPVEIVPLAARMNTLFAAIQRALDNERRFTADAAHELRTPLAAIKAQAQVARTASDAGERGHALDQVISGCDRATHLVEQMLLLARLDAQTTETLAPLDLRALLEDVLAEMAGAAISHGCELTLTAEAAEILGNPVLLRVLIRNLVNNALGHGAPSHIDVTLREATTIRLTVADDGRGIQADDLARLGQRFRRLASADFAAPTTVPAGSGLGLSIVRRIAELHNARLDFSTGPNGLGLVVSLEFPQTGSVPAHR